MQHSFRYPYKTATITLSNTGAINYIDEGSGARTLLFIHGLANYALGWRKNIDGLRSRYRCIAIDLPGNGLSEYGPFKYSIAWFAEVISEFAAALKLSNLTLVGHSMGGQIAMTAALNHPALADRLVLCAPAGFELFTPWEAALFQTSVSVFDYFASERDSITKSIRSSFFHNTRQGDEMISDLIDIMSTHPVSEYRSMITACIHGMLHEPVYHRLASLLQPTLIIFGERDAFIPTRALHPVSTREVAEDGASHLPNASLRLLPDCGHFVQWEKAGEVNRLIIGHHP